MSPYDEFKIQNDGHTDIIDPYLASEKQFELWNLSDSPKKRKCFPNSELLNEASFSDLDTSVFKS